MEIKNKDYSETKKRYNSSLSTFQISKELHNNVKEYCRKHSLKIREFLEKLISNNI